MIFIHCCIHKLHVILPIADTYIPALIIIPRPVMNWLAMIKLVSSEWEIKNEGSR